MNDAKRTNKLVFKESQIRYKKSVTKLKKNIKAHFKPHLNDAQIELLFFEDWKVKQHKELLDTIKAIDKANGTLLMNKYNLFSKNFIFIYE